MSPPTFGVRRALALFAAFLGVQLAIAIPVAVVTALHAIRTGSVPGAHGLDVDPRVTIAAGLGGTAVGGLVVLLLARRMLPATPEAGAMAELGWRRASATDCLHAALTGLGLVVLFVVAGHWLPDRAHDLGPLARIAQAGGGLRAAWAALAVFVAPPVEELVFRGVVYAGLARVGPPPLAGFVTTLVFVAMHATEIGTFWPAWVGLGLLSTLAWRARARSGSLLPAIALHASYNLGLVLTVYVTG